MSHRRKPFRRPRRGNIHDVPAPAASANCKWIVLSNATIGMLLATINASILLIALPDIFRGIHINPLAPADTNYLLWMILSFLIVTAVLVVSLGRIGDMYGRVRIYSLGFAVFTMFSILLFATPLSGSAGALWLIGMRVGQGIGGAMLFANSRRSSPTRSRRTSEVSGWGSTAWRPSRARFWG
jgi:MFS family permease